MDKPREATKSKRNLPTSDFANQDRGEVEAEVASLNCLLSELKVFSTGSSKLAGTILSQDEPIALEVTAEFGYSGAIALMPLGLEIRADFFVKPIGRGEELELGCAIERTTANQFIYTPTLQIEAGLKTLGLVPDKTYRITALVRVGAPYYPAFVTGFLEGLMIQVYDGQTF
jgi:hypothetical protein